MMLREIEISTVQYNQLQQGDILVRINASQTGAALVGTFVDFVGLTTVEVFNPVTKQVEMIANLPNDVTVLRFK